MSLLKRQRDRELESAQLSQIGKREKSRCLNKEALMNILKIQLNELSEENLKVRKRLSEVQAEID